METAELSIAAAPSPHALLALLQAGRVYEFIPRAEAHLFRHPEDDNLRILAVREYLKLGLVEPARTLLDADTVQDGTPLGDIRRQLRALDASVIPWSSRAATFENNLAALERRGSATLETSRLLKEAWQKHSADFQLFADSGRVTHVRRRAGRGWQWIPFFGDHHALAQAQPLPTDSGAMFPGPFLFEGLDLGYFFERVYTATLHTFLQFSCALYVVEPDPVLFALVLHLHDWADMLSDERVLLFLGKDAAHRLASTWQHDLSLPTPTHAYRLNNFRDGCSPPVIEVVHAETARREQAVEQSCAALARHFAERDRSYWAARFDDALSGNGKPLSIVAAVSLHTTFLQYSMEDARRAVEALGHRMTVLKERRPFETVHPLAYHQAIRDFDADLFFSIDHLRPEFGALLPDNLPLFTWDQDGLPQVLTRGNIAGISPLDFVAGSTKARFLAEGGRPQQYLSSYVPTCPQRFAGPGLTAAERARFACDVSYVSHASQTPRAFHDEERARPDYAAYLPLLDTLYELLPAYLRTYRVVGGALPAAILHEAQQRTGLRVSDPALLTRLEGWYLWRLGDRMFRHEALEWVGAWAQTTGRSFRIHGHGWDKHPTLSRFAAGPVENGRDLLCLYRASRINLQLMPAGFIHQRALDGLAAGGFFLTRLVPADLRGYAFHRLAARLAELSISSTPQLLSSPDPELRRLLRLLLGQDVTLIDPRRMPLHQFIPLWAQLPYCDELFEDFDELTFDSQDEFAAAAERFLADEPLRNRRADAMRSVVVERFSYQSTMKRFLCAMRDWLKSEPTVTPEVHPAGKQFSRANQPVASGVLPP